MLKKLKFVVVGRHGEAIDEQICRGTGLETAW